MPPQADEDPRTLKVITSGSHGHDPQAGSRSQIGALSIVADGLFFFGILSQERLRCESCQNHSNRVGVGYQGLEAGENGEMLVKRYRLSVIR